MDQFKIVRKVNDLMRLGKFSEAIELLDVVILSRPQIQSLKAMRQYCELKKNKSNEVPHLSNLLDKLNKRKLCVCLNVTSREIDRVKKLFSIWVRLERKNQQINPIADLKICFDKLSLSERDEVNALVLESGVREIFNEVEVISIDIPEKFNFYKREVDGTVDISDIKYGYKSGPNYQFFSIFNNPKIRVYDYVLMVESDCYPTCSGWITKIFDEAERRSPFWVLGSPFRGKSKIGPDIALHINGVAVYATGQKDFYSMLNDWELRLIDLVSIHPNIAYDWALEAYFNKIVSVSNWASMTYHDIRDFVEYRKMFIFSDTIINLAGESERGGKLRYQFSELQYEFPCIALVHGDYFQDDAIKFLGED